MQQKRETASYGKITIQQRNRYPETLPSIGIDTETNINRTISYNKIHQKKSLLLCGGGRSLIGYSYRQKCRLFIATKVRDVTLGCQTGVTDIMQGFRQGVSFSNFSLVKWCFVGASLALQLNDFTVVNRLRCSNQNHRSK